MKTIQSRITRYGDGVECCLRLFGIDIWTSTRVKNTGWFRLFGRGLRWKHEKVGLTFSEREGHRKYLKIGKWIYGYLPKDISYGKSYFYCQRDIEGESKCEEQCDHCKEYYAPLENEHINKDVIDIKAWFGSWEELRKRIEELEDDEKEEAFERNERNKVN